jgi:hypothetical protein
MNEYAELGTLITFAFNDDLMMIDQGSLLHQAQFAKQLR